MPLQQGVMNAQRKQLQAIAKGFTIHYASVHMRRRHTVVNLCICVCIYKNYVCNLEFSKVAKIQELANAVQAQCNNYL